MLHIVCCILYYTNCKSSVVSVSKLFVSCCAFVSQKCVSLLCLKSVHFGRKLLTNFLFIISSWGSGFLVAGLLSKWFVFVEDTLKPIPLQLSFCP